jgi:lipopolysaccharide export system protein LptA
VKNRSILAIATLIAISGVSLAQQPTTGKPKRAKSPTPRTVASPTPKSSASSATKPNDLLSEGSKNKGPTEITARDTFDFDGASRTGVFIGNVKVVDPDFTMTTDKLTVHMAKQEEGGGLSSADAEGNVIIVHANQSKNPKGGGSPSAVGSPTPTPTSTPRGGSTLADPPSSPQPSPSPALVLSTGRAQKAIYEAKDQSMTLIGWPQVTQGNNTHISTEEGTRMILYRDGRLKTFGGSRTIIQDKSEATKPAASPKQQ